MAETSVMEERSVPETRYAYYRRCQVFRKGGVQCKAPAEKGAHICHAHAGQLAMAVRRERERQAVLAEAVAQMRRRGRPECEAADLFMDFKGINVTLAVMMQAVVDGRIDCKTAGRLVVQLQTVSKLLRIYHREHRGTQRRTMALTTTKDAKRHEGCKNLPLISTDGTDLKKSATIEDQNLIAEARRRGDKSNTERNWAPNHFASNERETARIALVSEVRAVVNGRGWAHAPPELLRAA